MKKAACCLIAFGLSIAPTIPAVAASFPPVHSERGMAVSATREASQAGIAMLERGGNAIDAAVAMGFALAVTFPQAGNIGGGGFLVARLEDGRLISLDFREAAPAAAHRDLFLDAEGNVRSEWSLESALASGVPGSVDGLLRALEDHGSGKLTRQDVIEPAIRLAEGFPISRFFASELNGRRQSFERDSGARAIFIRDGGQPWRAGGLLTQHDLAATLRRIADDGRDGFYHGRTAGLFVAKMAQGNGIITHADLAAYRSVYREPVRGSWKSYEVVSMGPPSSGGLLIIHMLNMLSHLPFEEHGWNSAGSVHLLTEVQRRAYADRAEHLGDPDFWDVPTALFLSQPYAKKRAGAIQSGHATRSEDILAGRAVPENENTTHYSVADEAGNAVVVTTTLNTGYGSGLLVDGAGFFLNNEMDDFAAKPGVPNVFGLLGGDANAIAPGKRPLSSMTPTIVLENGEPRYLIGTPGGSTIITTVLQIILNLTVHGMNIQEAVDAPRVHSQWLPDEIRAERRALSDDSRRLLEAMGHEITVHPRRTIGRAHCIAILDGAFHGAADPRERDGAAIGY